MKVDNSSRAAYDAGMPAKTSPVSARIGSDGRLLIPKSLRSQLGIEANDLVTLQVDGGTLVVKSWESALRRLQSALKDIPTKSGLLLSEELILERRAEAAREFGEADDVLPA